MKVLYPTFFTVYFFITLGSKVVFSLVFQNRCQTNQRIAIEGSNVTLITDAKLAFEAIPLPK